MGINLHSVKNEGGISFVYHLFIYVFSIILTWFLAASDLYAQCGNISTLPCPDVVKTLPVNLNFTGSEGGLANTGFTMVMHPSSPLSASTDPTIGTPDNASVPGFVSSKLALSSDALSISTNKGLFFKCPAASANTNSQINALGVGFNANTTSFRIQTTIANPNFSASIGNTNSQQGGIWFGLDENRAAKIVIFKTGTNSGKVQVQLEDINAACTGVPANLPELNTENDVINNTYHIDFRINPFCGNSQRIL